VASAIDIPDRSVPVIVGISGGVDSAVAALRLRRAGAQVQGLFMSNWDEDDAYCSVAADFQDARAVCRELGIPLHRVSFAEEYRQRVFADFLAEHRAGRTPNPDVLCNREIKFGVCLAYARRLGGELLATGHYARRVDDAAGAGLHKGVDPGKDQSYFLHAVGRAELARAIFPIGGLPKPEVRAMAREAGLPVHDKPDSTGICFIGERPFREFLARHLDARPGPIESDDGEHLGEHMGLAFHTLGQRSGLGIGGRSQRPEAPWYAAAKDPVRNVLVVVQGHDHPLLMSTELESGPAHWLVEPPRAAFDAAVKLRHRQADQPARVTPLADGRLRVEFATPQRAATPGQSVVVYAGERCLGGAVIERTVPLVRRGAAVGGAL
jgi:tRNA-specific 2-thiouridylase